MHLYHIHLHAFQHIYASLHRTWTKIGHYPDLKKKQTAYVEYPRGVHNIFWKTYFRETNLLWKFLLIFIEFHLKNVCPFQDGGFSWKLHSFLKHFFEKNIHHNAQYPLNCCSIPFDKHFSSEIMIFLEILQHSFEKSKSFSKWLFQIETTNCFGKNMLQITILLEVLHFLHFWQHPGLFQNVCSNWAMHYFLK